MLERPYQRPPDVEQLMKETWATSFRKLKGNSNLTLRSNGSSTTLRSLLPSIQRQAS